MQWVFTSTCHHCTYQRDDFICTSQSLLFLPLLASVSLIERGSEAPLLSAQWPPQGLPAADSLVTVTALTALNHLVDVFASSKEVTKSTAEKFATEFWRYRNFWWTWDTLNIESIFSTKSYSLNSLNFQKAVCTHIFVGSHLCVGAKVQDNCSHLLPRQQVNPSVQLKHLIK